MEYILGRGDYAVVKTNPTPKSEKKLNELLRELWEKEDINKTGYVRLGATYSAARQLYGAAHRKGNDNFIVVYS